MLYFAQGLPSGLLGKALPPLLRDQGVSLSAIGFTALLALPWTLKFLWAPFPGPFLDAPAVAADAQPGDLRVDAAGRLA